MPNNLKIKLLNIILNYINARDWKNYDNFAEDFVDRIIKSFSRGNFDIDGILAKSSSTFFSLNSIDKKSFLSPQLLQRIKESWETLALPPSFQLENIFPEIKAIPDNEVISVAIKLDLPESKIQDILREAFRSKGASPIPRRGKDSPLEVADIEHFKMTVYGRQSSFAIVVKGYRSIRGSKLSWADVSHQITKAYSATHPDYIMLFSAKEPKDGLITALAQFAQDVGNQHLIIFIPPMDLARLLRAFRVI